MSAGENVFHNYAIPLLYITTYSASLGYNRSIHQRHLNLCLCANLGSGDKCQGDTAIVSQAVSRAKNYPLLHSSHTSNGLSSSLYYGQKEWRISWEQCVIVDTPTGAHDLTHCFIRRGLPMCDISLHEGSV